ncbi:MAG: ABC transporter ATP-binding protein [Planctomycetota bacterium]
MNTEERKPLLEIKELSKSYYISGRGEINVFDKFSITFFEREISCIIGGSGCGKTTFLKIISGAEEFDGGRIIYKGQEKKRVEKVAFVFQDIILLPWLTVKENIEFILRTKNLSAKEAEEKALHFIMKIGLEGYEEAYPKELSKGMQQRVGLARALACEPELLLMDEPFANLDFLTASYLRDEFLNIWFDPTIKLLSTILVTHTVDEAVYLADRIIVLSKNPARVTADICVELPRPRNRKDPKFEEYMDTIFASGI